MGISRFVDGLSRLGQSPRARMAIPAALFLVTVALRIAVVWSTPVRPLNPDHAEFKHLARNLVEHGRYGFTDEWIKSPESSTCPWRAMYDSSGMMREPGYPALLAGFGLLFGENDRAYQAFLAVVEGLTVVLIFELGRALLGLLAGVAGALLWSVNFGMLDNMAKLGREPLLALLVTVGVCLTIRAARRNSLAGAMLAGLVFGLSGYFKVTITYVGGLAALWLILLGWRRRSRLALAGLAMALCAGLTWVPWIARNSIIHGRLVGFSNLSGWILHRVLVDPAWIEQQSQEFQKRYDPFQAPSGVEADSRYKVQVRAYLKEHPFKALGAAVRNAPLFWSPFGRRVYRDGVTSPAQLVVAAYYVACFILGAAGLWIYRRRAETGLVVLILLAMTAMHALVFGWPRYRYPFDPLLLLYAGGAVAACLKRLRSTGDAGVASGSVGSA